MTTLHAENPRDNEILKSLDDDQYAAASTIEGPVRITAGAGAGKTRTITHRMAYACSIGAWNPGETMAVTFSVKAAEEMKTRLMRLGASEAIQAATFHSAALSQVRTAWYELSDAPFPQIIEDPRALLAVALKRVSGTDDIEAMHMRDILAEIGWMKVSLIAPDDYVRVCSALHRVPPADLDPQSMAAVMSAFEQEKSSRNQIDFNDILLIDCNIIERHPEVAESIRKRTKHVTVDEYQDVSPLQHRLLQLWMGKGRSICVVGDAAQTIYSFAGASSYYLRHFAEEFGPLAADVELNTDYRSTPQIVNYANMVLSRSPDSETYLTLQSPREQGKRVNTVVFPDDTSEVGAIAQRISRMLKADRDMGSIAILTRVNAQQRAVCAALGERKIRYQVRTDSGWQSSRIDSAQAEALSRVQDQDASQTDEERSRAAKNALRTVTVSTIHAAKGLEFSHVFIIGCSEGLIPFGSGQNGSLEEERRLMYVGITRAEDVLTLSFAKTARGNGYTERKPSRFLLRGRA
ncbi:MAG: ATP-dependent helicase [Bifidobacterium aquikefiri]|uniref:ATP-dependent helicase n=1 Tax=Bifidobacterium aquikefiri TaxID=1653207 RepID=UPI001FCE6DF2|nr:ATP-dependent helicase [Bifidobacterium aquikefiri]